MSQRYPYEQYKDEVEKLLKKGYGRNAIYNWLAEQTGKSYNAVKKAICKQGWDNVFRGLQTANREWVNHPSYKEWHPDSTVANNETPPFRKMSDYPTSRKDYGVSSKTEQSEPIKSTNGSTQTEYKEKRNNDGSIEITDIVDRKLTDAELFERYGRSQDDWRISMVWFKDRRDGFLLSCCFIPLLKEKDVQLKRIIENILDEVKQYAPKYHKLNYVKSRDNHLFVIDPADIHMGKLSKAFETGEDYNHSIARERVMDGVSGLLQKAQSFDKDKILLIIGNDILHVDTPKNSTTSGTPQDVCGIWYDNFLMAKKLYVDVIEMLLPIAPIHVQYDPSNHDYTNGFFLADTIKSWFNNCKDITFNTSIAHRKYTRYHNNLIGTTHGDGAKVTDLAQLMAHEASEYWNLCKHKYYYTHHIHHKYSKDFMSVTVESLRTPSSADSWHHRNGYQHAPKAVEGFIHHPLHGQIARITHLF